MDDSSKDGRFQQRWTVKVQLPDYPSLRERGMHCDKYRTALGRDTGTSTVLDLVQLYHRYNYWYNSNSWRSTGKHKRRKHKRRAAHVFIVPVTAVPVPDRY